MARMASLHSGTGSTVSLWQTLARGEAARRVHALCLCNCSCAEAMPSGAPHHVCCRIVGVGLGFVRRSDPGALMRQTTLAQTRNIPARWEENTEHLFG